MKKGTYTITCSKAGGGSEALIVDGYVGTLPGFPSVDVGIRQACKGLWEVTDVESGLLMAAERTRKAAVEATEAKIEEYGGSEALEALRARNLRRLGVERPRQKPVRQVVTAYRRAG